MHFTEKKLRRPLLMSGCGRITVSDVCGTYRRQVAGIVDTLTLSTNGYFKQTITHTNGGAWLVEGSWSLKSQEGAQFNELLDCYDLEHGSIRIPPRSVLLITLWVERGRLAANQEEPKWIKVK